MQTINKKFDVNSDAPDLRDRYYEPRLAPLQPAMDPPGDLTILDQGNDGACTGFGLAAVINRLYQLQNHPLKVSPWMLYHMARRYDEWAGEDYSGSSCRGAIKGWQNSGVCLDELYGNNEAGLLGFEQLEDAKSRTIGAYYRIHPQITDMHSAINETGIIYVSAAVHAGWQALVPYKDGQFTIERSDSTIGGHAFAIVGYNEDGFWVQNSWGEDWGHKGIALWRYEDWLESVYDAWVIQVALPTPQIFDRARRAGTASAANPSESAGAPSHSKIWNHFVHFDDGKFHDGGRYWSNESQVFAIADNMRRHAQDFDHVLFYAHGGLNSIKASAKRIAAMKDVYLANRIYPFHFMYDTGLLEELKDVLMGKFHAAEHIAGSIGGSVIDWFDRRVENLTRVPGRAVWREMKRGATLPFARPEADGAKTLKILTDTINEIGGKKVHVVGHSTGAILHGHLLQRIFQDGMLDKIDTCSLLAPAATYTLFNENYAPLIRDQLLGDIAIYNLSDDLETGDNVAGVYRKSLLYLVSNAFEDKRHDALLGMKVFNEQQDNAGVTFHYSHCDATASKSHGGFDNDPATMNHLLTRVLGQEPARPFKPADLNY
ncbi:C1 family peptidase [Microbulbifer sp. SAOS-129_SWC]|uniref:C1 family peptidase n=1 Tax=Microbulbifer sp. SAOS-129_SWC TaxID=3145235 RepID=UPI003217662E